jgi:hypothetical protein
MGAATVRDPAPFGSGKARLGDDAHLVAGAGPRIKRFAGEALAVVQLAVAQGVGVGGVEEAYALVEGEVDEGDGILFRGAPLCGEAKQAEPKGNVEGTQDAVGGGFRGHGRRT